jgi:hypothetical protein
MTTSSYPFLTLSRCWHADYGDVLAYANLVETRLPSSAGGRAALALSPACRRAVLALCGVPIERRHLVDIEDLTPYADRFVTGEVSS